MFLQLIIFCLSVSLHNNLEWETRWTREEDDDEGEKRVNKILSQLTLCVRKLYTYKIHCLYLAI